MKVPGSTSGSRPPPCRCVPPVSLAVDGSNQQKDPQTYYTRRKTSLICWRLQRATVYQDSFGSFHLGKKCEEFQLWYNRCLAPNLFGGKECILTLKDYHILASSTMNFTCSPPSSACTCWHDPPCTSRSPALGGERNLLELHLFPKRRLLAVGNATCFLRNKHIASTSCNWTLRLKTSKIPGL